MDAEFFVLLLSHIVRTYHSQPYQTHCRNNVSQQYTEVHESTFEIQGNTIGRYRRMVIVAMHLSKHQSKKKNQQIHLKSRLKFKHSNW